jgi:hypothetical protein
VAAEQHLQSIEQGILGQVQPEHAETLEKIVVSGRQILFDAETREQVWKGFKDIDDDSDPRKVAHGVAAILTLINRESDAIPVELMVPAGALLAVEVLKFLDEAGMLPADPAFTGNTIEELLAALMQKSNIGKDPTGGVVGPGQPQQPPQPPAPPAEPTVVPPPPDEQGILASRRPV